ENPIGPDQPSRGADTLDPPATDRDREGRLSRTHDRPGPGCGTRKGPGGLDWLRMSVIGRVEPHGPRPGDARDNPFDLLGSHEAGTKPVLGGDARTLLQSADFGPALGQREDATPDEFHVGTQFGAEALPHLAGQLGQRDLGGMPALFADEPPGAA